MATVGMIANAGTQSLLWGNALDKYKKPTEFVAIGELLAGIGHIFMVFGYQFFLGAGNPIGAGYVIILILGIIEVFWSMSNVGWSALLSELTEDDERKKIMAQLSIIGGFGGIGGAILGGFLYDNGLGFANGSIFFIAAIVMIISSGIVYIAMRKKKDLVLIENDEQQPVYNPPLSDLPRKLRNAYLIFIFALVLINFGRNSIAIINSLFLSDPSGFGATGDEIAFVNNVGSVASMIAGVLMGSFISKADDNKVMLVGTGLAIVGIGWLIYAPSLLLVNISAFLIGASQVVIQASSYAIVARITPENYRGRLFAYYNATFFLSWGIAATLVTGPVADILIASSLSYADAYRGSFATAILLILLGVVVLLYSFRYTATNLDVKTEREEVIEWSTDL